MEPYESYLALGTALAVGLLIGLEREQNRKDAAEQLAGIRTYPIIAIIGALATMLEPSSMWLPLIALGGLFALIAISYAADVRERKDHGVTTEVAAVATFLLGALAASRGVVEPMSERFLLVAGLAVAITFLLSAKPWFHSIAQRLSRDDFYASIKFLIVAVIALPLLPDRDLGPLAAINPFHLGLLVVTISGLSFVGYIAMRAYGAGRGMLLGAALGGLVSSTAVTLSFAGRVKQNQHLAPIASGAIAVASTVKVIRVGVLIALVDLSLATLAAIPLGAMAIACMIGGAITYRRDKPGATDGIEVKNPFELASAIKFALLFGVILIVTKAATTYVGDSGLYVASAIGGAADVDPVTLSAAKLAHQGLADSVAVVAVVLAVAANTIVKTGLAASGSRRLGKLVAISSAAMLAAGGIALAVVLVI
ncbi:MAG: MgtC/SapB family protein [Kofleriaceae bacterium]